MIRNQPRQLLRMILSGYTMLLAPGCDGNRAASAERPPPAPKTAQVTVWGERFEIFLEHRVIVAGEPTTLVTHVTDLATLEPRREGPITILLRQGAEAPIAQVEPAPARAGIYTPTVIFTKPGAWDVSVRIPLDAGGETVVILPRFTAYGSSEQAASAPEDETPQGISFLKEQQWKVRMKAEPVAKRRLAEQMRSPGLVLARPHGQAAVTPAMAGRLLAPPAKNLPQIGESVAAGQVLALVQPPFTDFAVKLVESYSNVLRTKLAVDQAELVLERTRKLVNDRARSERELSEADFNARMARSDHEAAQAIHEAYRKTGAVFVPGNGIGGEQGGLPSLELRAPVAGVITSVRATQGAYVAENQAVFTIIDPSRVLIQANIAESSLNRVAPSMRAFYETLDAPGQLVPITGDAARGGALVGLEVDPASRTVPLTYEATNADLRLRIGMSLNVFVETAHVEEGLALPDSAIVDEDGRPIAYVQVSGETLTSRDLELGIRDGGYVHVISGIAAGERVVTKGAYAIRLASVSTVIPAHGHAH